MSELIHSWNSSCSWIILGFFSPRLRVGKWERVKTGYIGGPTLGRKVQLRPVISRWPSFPSKIKAALGRVYKNMLQEWLFLCIILFLILFEQNCDGFTVPFLFVHRGALKPGVDGRALNARGRADRALTRSVFHELTIAVKYRSPRVTRFQPTVSPLCFSSAVQLPHSHSALPPFLFSFQLSVLKRFMVKQKSKNEQKIKTETNYWAFESARLIVLLQALQNQALECVLSGRENRIERMEMNFFFSSRLKKEFHWRAIIRKIGEDDYRKLLGTVSGKVYNTSWPSGKVT